MKNRILEILKNDSRFSNEDIAKMLDTSAEEVARIKQELEDQHIILKYSIVINDELFDDGKGAVVAFIEVRVTPKRDKGFDSIANRLKEFAEVESVYLMSGAYDLLVVVKGDSLKDIAKFVSERLAPVGKVLSTATHFLLKKYKENGVIMAEESEKSSRLKVSF